ncbi:MAG: OsmC family protein [Calditrichaeota bacterium]|jgi:putative redox protein|nr:OsmC family protein [Calditrichota bacterium]MBT7789015.1 OsmC family protein [Calditrichota bacterium]
MEMQVTIKQIEGLAIAAKGGSNTWSVMDTAEGVGGLGGGTRPLELMLMGIAGCASMDVIAILRKKRVDVRNFEVNVVAERKEKHPQSIKEITFNYSITGKDIQPEDVEKAISLSDSTYCGAIDMIRGCTEINHQYTIHESE